MDKRFWTKIGIAVAALALAIAAGTTVYALSGNDDDGGPSATREADDARLADPGAGDAIAGMCIEGVPDCVDTVVDPNGGDGDFAQCAADGPDCQSFVDEGEYAECAADGGGCPQLVECPDGGDVCIEPWLMDPPVCPAGVEIDECFPDGIPAGYECVTLESFPVQVSCTTIPCDVTTLPAPIDEDGVTTLPAPADDPPAGSREAEEAAREGEVKCVPPAPECDDTSRCLPPDCAVSSDGSVSCPDVIDPCVPGPAVDCGILPDEGAGSSPGNPGDGGTAEGVPADE
jgi:hypothetical protein